MYFGGGGEYDNNGFLVNNFGNNSGTSCPGGPIGNIGTHSSSGPIGIHDGSNSSSGSIGCIHGTNARGTDEALGAKYESGSEYTDVSGNTNGAISERMNTEYHVDIGCDGGDVIGNGCIHTP